MARRWRIVMDGRVNGVRNGPGQVRGVRASLVNGPRYRWW